MIADIIHRVAAMGAKPQQPFYPRPSLAGPERCIRQMVYHGLGFPPTPITGRTVLVFDDSEWHEQLTADWLRQSAYPLHSTQLAVQCRPPMGEGHIDGILTGEVLHDDWLLEHKALNHFSFERYSSGKEMPTDYLYQLGIYLEALQRTLLPDLKGGVLLIKNKNTSQYLEFLCRYNPGTDTLTVYERTSSVNSTAVKMDYVINDLVTSACQKFVLVMDYISRRVLPKRAYTIDHWRCQYCEFSVRCYKGWRKEFETLTVGGMLPSEVEDMVRYYQETGAHASEMDRERKVLGEKIKAAMIAAGIREGKAGEYGLRMTLNDRGEPRLFVRKLIADVDLTPAQQRLLIKLSTRPGAPITGGELTTIKRLQRDGLVDLTTEIIRSYTSKFGVKHEKVETRATLTARGEIAAGIARAAVSDAVQQYMKGG